MPRDVAGCNVRYSPFQVGLVLWVRETWAAHWMYDDLSPTELLKEHSRCQDDANSFWFRADGDDASGSRGCPAPGRRGRWRSSIHMPRSTSRIQLGLTAVRVERVQEITVQDIIAEGIEVPNVDYKVPERPDILDHERECWARGEFHRLWDELNLKRAPWDSDPWVWILEFRRLK